MAGRDINRAYDIKRLFDKMLDKVDPKLDHKGRMAQAAELMDKHVGPEWRGEVKLPGITVIEIQTVDAKPAKPAQDPESFYDKLHKKLYAEGSDFKDEGGLDEVEAKQKRSTQDLPSFLDELQALLDKYKGGSC